MRFANAGSVLNSVSKVMSSLEADPIKALVVSDLGGMVLPRTAIEGAKRGIIPAQETFFREITGTVTNTFLAGWLGFLAAWGLSAQRANPKAMNMKAWIDSGTLEAFGKVTQELLENRNIQTAAQLREGFLKAVLGRMESTDNVWRLPQFKEALKDTANGRLNDNTLKTLVDRFMRGGSRGAHHAFNVEEQVMQTLKQPEYRQEIKTAAEALEEKFIQAQGNQPLSRLQQVALKNKQIGLERSLIARQKQEIRKEITRRIRTEEKRFLQEMADIAVKRGKLTDEVFLLDAKGKPLESLGPQPLNGMLRKTKHYMEEFLNRALTHESTGKMPAGPLNKALVKQRMFGRTGKSWMERYLYPQMKDGLLPYAYKFKNFTVLLPVLVTIGIGCSMVLINNYITRRKTGANYFPGEQALLEKGLGKGGHA